jgi:hypothetical protein
MTGVARAEGAGASGGSILGPQMNMGARAWLTAATAP